MLDTLSKFGTLALNKSILEIPYRTTTAIQIGRSLIICKSKPSALRKTKTLIKTKE